MIVSMLVVGFTCVAMSVYSHWKQLQKQDQEIREISELLVMIVNDIEIQTRDRSRPTAVGDDQV